MFSAIILAAGKSTRMGELKPLVQFGKQTFLETILQNFRNAGIEDVLIVLGYKAEQIAKELNLRPDDFTINKNYSLGQFSSVQAGVKNLKSNCTGVFLALVDQPQIGSDIIAKIRKNFEDNPDKIVIPTLKGKRGHPPVLPKWLFHEILTANPTLKTSAIIRNYAHKVSEVEIDDDSILWNMNTKQDLEKILSS
ncbi:nucleotidyltransferase family protein [candidate division KSB1 bacterium]|nr:nucleotidyltransferase family protein [candidate division KSB1 bacterium]